jgi:isopentenyl diphosphate isomerase/L-lactate dehydrogenase-like FMN-dependent dehydrogenase
VLKAAALGARGTYIGRTMLYGLGALAKAGVTKALNIIKDELDPSIAFCGKTRMQSVNRDSLSHQTLTRHERIGVGILHIQLFAFCMAVL